MAENTALAENAACFDAIIIGGGPAGLNAALFLGRACRQTILIDDGKPRNAAARQVHGFLSRDGISPRELVQHGRAEVLRYGVSLIDSRVVDVESLTLASGSSSKTRFAIVCASGQRFIGRKLLFASGMTDALPELPGVRECYGATIHHCPYCDGWEHRGKRLLAYGNTARHAMGLGLSLRTWSQHVVVLTNGQLLDEEMKARLKANQVRWRADPLVRLRHNGDQLVGAELVSGEVLPADALFFNTPQDSRCDLARKLGCNQDSPARTKTTDKQQTSVRGVYLAGDADGDVQFAIIAAAEGATAAVAINRQLQEEDQSS